MRSAQNEDLVYPIFEDINPGDRAEDGGQLRPHIVWFGEPVYMIEEAIPIMQSADVFVLIGTSLVVYPAAGLVNYAPWPVPKFVIDKNIPSVTMLYNLTAIEKPATEGLRQVQQLLEPLV